MPQVRSGSHLRQIGNVWYYRRAVPPDVRDVFGVAEVKKSLNTSNRREAEQREKAEDTKFEARLTAARETGPDGLPRDPEKRTAELVGQIYRNLDDPESIDEAIAQVPAQYRDAVIERIEEYEDEERSSSPRSTSSGRPSYVTSSCGRAIRLSGNEGEQKSLP